jgi:signal transduction histidine kinase
METHMDQNETVQNEFANDKIGSRKRDSNAFSLVDCAERKETMNVLVVEDDRHYQRLIRHVLTTCHDQKFNLTSAYSLAQALEQLLWQTPDVILLDLHLPDSTGLKTMRQIQEVAQGAPIVIITGTTDEASGVESVALGAQDFLVKQNVSHSSVIRGVRFAAERRKVQTSALRFGAIRDFTAALSHDLTAPLLGANNVLDMLLSEELGPLTPEQAKMVSLLRESTSRQLHLIQKLVQVYKYESGEQPMTNEPVDLRAVIEHCAERIQPPTEKSEGGREIQAQIVCDLPDTLPLVCGDEEALQMLFDNLLDNAVKYGMAGGQITVTSEVSGENLAIHVHNFGPVIPLEVQHKLFQQFWQGVPGKNYVANTGLGLYFCHRIASLHRGRITCESSPENGTTMTVRLPALVRKQN